MSLYTLRIRIRELFRFRKTAFALRWSLRLAILLFIMDTGYLVGIWPDWHLYSEGPIQQSSFIRTYISAQYKNKDWPDYRWEPVSIDNISEHIIRAVVVAEDARFYTHTGIDTDALKQAMEYNLSKKRFVYGASTLSQQTVKNIFLSPSRNPLRKWHEFVLTAGMEYYLTKERILELYMNVAEFGRGIYGVEAASQYYWGTSAIELSSEQAIELAATLSAPVGHNPKTQSSYFKKRVSNISRYF